MPSIGAVKAAQQRRYAQSTEGRAARARAYAKRKERHRQQSAEAARISINPAPLAQVLTNWRTQ